MSGDFPCLGARAAFRKGTYRFEFLDELGSPAAAEGLARGLRAFLDERKQWDTDYSTFAASFAGPQSLDEVAFEQLLWKQLRLLHAVDADSTWDPQVSADPADPRFGFSFAGVAFFVVGLHSGSSRYARRFAFPTLSFNPHEQFESLRRKGAFGRLRDRVRARDLALQGTSNPMLHDYGEQSEASQYSGRATGPEWRCPFPH